MPEVALYEYPGEIYTGRVLNTIDGSGEGQRTASGKLPLILGSRVAAKFAVKIKLDWGDELRLPGWISSTSCWSYQGRANRRNTRHDSNS